MHSEASFHLPRPGIAATVRNRYGVIASVDPFDGHEGRCHMVQIDYLDDQLPAGDQFLWELETNAQIIPPNELPRFEAAPMQPGEFDALLNSARWNATLPFLDPDGDGPLDRLPLASPFHGAFEVEDYQLVPVMKALAMPSVRLLIADDVGLGKTIEAGMILNELLLRRRIRRVLILTPASLRVQWQRDELYDKFSLRFDLVDRNSTLELKKRMGMDANPWRSQDRIITSFHYLKQMDVLDQFLSASRSEHGASHLPWDLLIVDEVHNLMPSPFGADSDLTQMLRLIAPLFEHKIFLSATPHNGHTRSFSGLLEILDPVRFSQTNEFKPAEKARISEVVVRRLKREINARSNPPKFCNRLAPQSLRLNFSVEELNLIRAFAAFRSSLRSILAARSKQKQRTGNFALEMLNKRLLSCPTAFAESWHRCKLGLLGVDAASESDIDAARKKMEEEITDDREANSREITASNMVGSWMKSVSQELEPEIIAIDQALLQMGFAPALSNIVEQNPIADERFIQLKAWIENNLFSQGQWLDTERLVIFTEYKTTLDYLYRRLCSVWQSDRIITLFGGMDDNARDTVKSSFNDPAASVRILLATDAASEGLNLQKHARYLLHFDCPWNPSRLEQRNGRVDRHGQARDVSIFHFVSNQDEDLRFLSKLLVKANDIREDLGSTNELFDVAAHKKLVKGEVFDEVFRELEHGIHFKKGKTSMDADASIATDKEAEKAKTQINAFAAELSFDGWAMRDNLELAMSMAAPGKKTLNCIEVEKTCKVLHPELSGWTEIIDENLRKPSSKNHRGALQQLAFGVEPFIEKLGDRSVYNSRTDMKLMHLGHPLIKKANSMLNRKRFPGSGNIVSRWCVKKNSFDRRYDALILLSLEEIAVNELRETFHQWVRTLVFPVMNGKLLDPLPHQPAKKLKGVVDVEQWNEELIEQARELAEDNARELKARIMKQASDLTSQMKGFLEGMKTTALKQEESRYKSRLGEVSTLISATTLERLNKEIQALEIEKQQGVLFGAEERLEQLEKSIEMKQQEIERQKSQHEEIRKLLEKEKERMMKHVLPKRFSLAGEVHVFPVTIEIQLPL